MNAIVSWASIICIAAIVGAMLQLLSPSGKMEKMVRFVFGAFMICALLTPLIGTMGKITFDFELDTSALEKTNEFTNHIDEQIAEAAGNNIRSLTQELLSEKKATAQKIEVFMDTGDNNSISITKIIITLDEEEKSRAGELKKAVEEKLGLTVEIVTS